MIEVGNVAIVRIGGYTSRCDGGLGVTHTLRRWDAGDDLLMNRLNITKDDVFRFVCQIRNLDSGCWEWLGGTDKKGYGKF